MLRLVKKTSKKIISFNEKNYNIKTINSASISLAVIHNNKNISPTERRIL